VAERLREVPGHLAAGRVDLLGQQADIVDGGHGTLERRGGGLDLSGQRLRQPERAQQERPLLTGQAVGGPVSVHQSALVGEPPGDGIDGRFHPRVIAWQESGDGQHQGRCVEVLAAERLGEGAGPLVPQASRGAE
jgi:hypothetical protein